MQHLRHVALPDQRGVGLEQQVVQQHRLAEVEQCAAHGRIMPRAREGRTTCTRCGTTTRASCGGCLLAGLAFVAIGSSALFPPVLPTTPFMLLAAACFARASTRFYNWLLNNPAFGRRLLQWRRHRSIPYREARPAIALMAVSLTVSIVFFVRPPALQWRSRALACSSRRGCARIAFPPGIAAARFIPMKRVLTPFTSSALPAGRWPAAACARARPSRRAARASCRSSPNRATPGAARRCARR